MTNRAVGWIARRVLIATLVLATQPAVSQPDRTPEAAPPLDERVYQKSELPEAVPSAVATRGVGGSDDEVSYRIAGGFPSPPGKWPSMVAIFARPPGKPPAFHCGGTVIDGPWVLTAAHCVVVKLQDGRSGVIRPEILFIREGTVDLARGGRNIEVREVRPHPGYSHDTKLNDIALLRLAAPAEAPRQHLGGRAAGPEMLRPGRPATITGFGRIKPAPASPPQDFDAGPHSQRLLQADVPIVAKDKCATRYKNVSSDATLCAGHDDGRADTCKGDSGGPLFVRDGVGQAIQVGVVSYGAGCAQPNSWGVYAAVPQFEGWIRGHVANASFSGGAAAPAPPPVVAIDQVIAAILGPQAGTAPSQSAQLTVDVLLGGGPEAAPSERVPIGAPFTVRVTSSMAGALLVYNRDEKGKVTQLFPHGRSPGTLPGQAPREIRAGATIRVPTSGYDGFQLKASAPAGLNDIIALVLAPGVKTEDLTRAYEGFKSLDDPAGTLGSLEVRVRDLEIVGRAPVLRAVGRRTFEILAK